MCALTNGVQYTAYTRRPVRAGTRSACSIRHLLDLGKVRSFPPEPSTPGGIHSMSDHHRGRSLNLVARRNLVVRCNLVARRNLVAAHRSLVVRHNLLGRRSLAARRNLAVSDNNIALAQARASQPRLPQWSKPSRRASSFA